MVHPGQVRSLDCTGRVRRGRRLESAGCSATVRRTCASTWSPSPAAGWCRGRSGWPCRKSQGCSASCPGGKRCPALRCAALGWSRAQRRAEVTRIRRSSTKPIQWSTEKSTKYKNCIGYYVCQLQFKYDRLHFKLKNLFIKIYIYLLYKKLVVSRK